MINLETQLFPTEGDFAPINSPRIKAFAEAIIASAPKDSDKRLDYFGRQLGKFSSVTAYQIGLAINDILFGNEATEDGYEHTQEHTHNHQHHKEVGHVAPWKVALAHIGRLLYFLWCPVTDDVALPLAAPILVAAHGGNADTAMNLPTRAATGAVIEIPDQEGVFSNIQVLIPQREALRR